MREMTREAEQLRISNTDPKYNTHYIRQPTRQPTKQSQT